MLRRLVRCLAGLYGCQWKRYRGTRTQPGGCCCNKNLGFWYPWSVVLLVIAASFFTYIAVLVMGIVVSLVFSVGAIAVLSDLWGDEWETLVLSFQVTAPYLHVGGVLLATALGWPVASHFFCMNSRGLIGHRGSPTLAPENTAMSFEKALEAGSLGLETDVAISYDGVPFLMHDTTLLRTTDVREVFPDRAHTHAALFSWSELERLNAGAWFLSHDPLLTFLELAAAAQRDTLVIFDLYQPPRDHPYWDSWIQRTLEVLWLPPYSRALVREIDPELQQTSSQLPLEELRRNRIVKVNLHYRDMSTELVGEYAEVNITTNLYVVNKPWLYSLAWCTGVTSVTTNTPHLLGALQTPLFLMTPGEWREQRLACNKAALEQGTYSKFNTEFSDVWSVSVVHAQREQHNARTSTLDLPPVRGC
ncbi:hypothetical protein NHX12_009892 [Muraenolepis orangiensis]|uniref:GP-PDE domain-containing protein n=1 Tax=Muraenolepis orangiensis TaxID=630683 RepID=A0A9Q0I7V9_9TELE|nr:hypothetical protein NHX12_009892 [Muraenolepis orangiensis]